MDERTESRVKNWESSAFPGGYAALGELADADFSGTVVSSGRTWLFMLNGRIVGIHEGRLADFRDQGGTVYRAPDPSLPLLFSMVERGGSQQAKYYTNDTPISEAHSQLSEAGFTGFIELSENVLSGDYYVVYYGGRSLPCAFVGSSERLLTGDEAFRQADDEVGIYEVRSVAVDVTDIPEPGSSPQPTQSAPGNDRPADGPDTTQSQSRTHDTRTEPPAEGRPASETRRRESATHDHPSQPEQGQHTPSADAGNHEERQPADKDSAPPNEARPRDERGHPEEGNGPGHATGSADAEGPGHGGDREETATPSESQGGGRGGPAAPPEPNHHERVGDEPARSAGESARGDDAAAEQGVADPNTTQTDRSGSTGPEGHPPRDDTPTDPSPETERDESPDQEASAGEAKPESATDATGASQADAREESTHEEPSPQTEPASGPQPDDPAESSIESDAAHSTERSTDAQVHDEPASETAHGDASIDDVDTDDGDAVTSPDPLPRDAFDELTLVPSLDPDRTGDGADPSDIGAVETAGPTATGSPTARQSPEEATGGALRSADAGTGPGVGGHQPGAAESLPDSDEESLREVLAEREHHIDELEARLADLRVQREGLRDERDDLRDEIEELEAELEAVETELESLREQIDDETEGRRQISEEEALSGTNLFVRYQSKGAGTLEKALGGEADRDDVNDNLQLEHHTTFATDDVAIEDQTFDDFLANSIYAQYVEWLVRDLPYEIRDTDNIDQLSTLYEALPRVDRAELLGDVRVEYTDGGETYRENRGFDVVLRDRMGNPLIVADVNDSRTPASDEMMRGVLENATEVKESNDSLAAGMLVTASFFDPGALETADEATANGGGLMGGGSRSSFVKLSRKRGYHLLLVETRDGDFHVNVPEL